MILANFNLDTSGNDYIVIGDTVEEVMEKAAKHLDPEEYNFDEIQWYEVSRTFTVELKPTYIVKD